jgi:hypothetical protein
MDYDERMPSVKAYFDGIAAKDMSRVPWAKDARTARTITIHGPRRARVESQSESNTGPKIRSVRAQVAASKIVCFASPFLR